MAAILVYITLTGCGKDEEGSSQAPPKPPGISLHEAVLIRDIAAIEKHIAAGSDIDEKDQFGSTPLIVASTFGVTKAAGILVENGANLYATNNEGSTPLHIASFLCHTETVELLLDAGADKSRKNDAGHTAFESVAGPFADVIPIYDYLRGTLGPLGLKLDYDYIEETRPKIAEMLLD